MPKKIIFEDIFVTEDELSRIMGVSRCTISRKRRQKNFDYFTFAIPHIRVGRRIYYRFSNVIRYEAAMRFARQKFLNHSPAPYPSEYDPDPSNWIEGPYGDVTTVREMSGPDWA